MERHADRTETSSGDAGAEPKASEDELAREMIARIARRVDLEMGRLPLEPSEASAVEDEGEGDAEEESETPVAGAPEVPVDEPAERSEEDVSRELVERIAREVDEELHG